MKNSVFTFGVLALIIIIATLTNPDQDRHKEVLKNKLNEFMQQSIMNDDVNSSNGWEESGSTFALIISGVIVDEILDNLVSTDNYIVFSTTRISWDGKSKIIGIGAFGNVYITKELDRALDEGLLKN